MLDCALDLDLPEALGIADSALRRRDVFREELTEAIQTLPRIGRERAAVVLRSAAEVAVNPFEFGLRGLAIEADSHEFHKGRTDIVRDGRRYDEMTLAGWVVLRFAWEHVGLESDWVREVIGSVVALRRARSDCRSATA